MGPTNHPTNLIEYVWPCGHCDNVAVERAPGLYFDRGQFSLPVAKPPEEFTEEERAGVPGRRECCRCWATCSLFKPLEACEECDHVFAGCPTCMIVDATGTRDVATVECRVVGEFDQTPQYWRCGSCESINAFDDEGAFNGFLVPKVLDYAEETRCANCGAAFCEDNWVISPFWIYLGTWNGRVVADGGPWHWNLQWHRDYATDDHTRDDCYAPRKGGRRRRENPCISKNPAPEPATKDAATSVPGPATRGFVVPALVVNTDDSHSLPPPSAGLTPFPEDHDYESEGGTMEEHQQQPSLHPEDQTQGSGGFTIADYRDNDGDGNEDGDEPDLMAGQDAGDLEVPYDDQDGPDLGSYYDAPLSDEPTQSRPDQGEARALLNDDVVPPGEGSFVAGENDPSQEYIEGGVESRESQVFSPEESRGMDADDEVEDPDEDEEADSIYYLDDIHFTVCRNAFAILDTPAAAAYNPPGMTHDLSWDEEEGGGQDGFAVPDEAEMLDDLPPQEQDDHAFADEVLLEEEGHGERGVSDEEDLVDSAEEPLDIEGGVEEGDPPPEEAEPLDDDDDECERGFEGEFAEGEGSLDEALEDGVPEDSEFAEEEAPLEEGELAEEEVPLEDGELVEEDALEEEMPEEGERALDTMTEDDVPEEGEFPLEGGELAEQDVPFEDGEFAEDGIPEEEMHEEGERGFDEEFVPDGEGDFLPQDDGEQVPLEREEEEEYLPESEGELPMEGEGEFLEDAEREMPLEDEVFAPEEVEGEFLPKDEGDYPLEAEGELPPEGEGDLPPEEAQLDDGNRELPLEDDEFPPDGEGEFLPEDEGELPPEGDGEFLPEGEGEFPPESEAEFLPEEEGDLPPEGESESLSEDEGGLPPEEAEFVEDGHRDLPLEDGELPCEGDCEFLPEDEEEEGGFPPEEDEFLEDGNRELPLDDGEPPPEEEFHPEDECDFVEGDPADGDFVDGEYPPDETPGDEFSQGEFPDAQYPERGSTQDNVTGDGFVDQGFPDEQYADGGFPEGQHDDGFLQGGNRGLGDYYGDYRAGDEFTDGDYADNYADEGQAFGTPVEGGFSEDAYPQDGNAGGGYPQGEYTERGYPQEGYTQRDYPRQVTGDRVHARGFGDGRFAERGPLNGEYADREIVDSAPPEDEFTDSQLGAGHAVEDEYFDEVQGSEVDGQRGLDEEMASPMEEEFVETHAVVSRERGLGGEMETRQQDVHEPPLEDPSLDEQSPLEPPLEVEPPTEEPPEESPLDEAFPDEPPLEEPSPEQLPLEEQPTPGPPFEEEEPPSEEPLEEQQSLGSPFEEPPEELLEKGPLEEPPVEEPSFEESPHEDAPLEEVPHEEPPLEEPPVEEPPLTELPPESSLEELPLEQPPSSDDQPCDESFEQERGFVEPPFADQSPSPSNSQSLDAQGSYQDPPLFDDQGEYQEPGSDVDDESDRNSQEGCQDVPIDGQAGYSEASLDNRSLQGSSGDVQKDIERSYTSDRTEHDPYSEDQHNVACSPHPDSQADSYGTHPVNGVKEELRRPISYAADEETHQDDDGDFRDEYEAAHPGVLVDERAMTPPLDSPVREVVTPIPPDNMLSPRAPPTPPTEQDNAEYPLSPNPLYDGSEYGPLTPPPDEDQRPMSSPPPDDDYASPLASPSPGRYVSVPTSPAPGDNLSRCASPLSRRENTSALAFLPSGHTEPRSFAQEDPYSPTSPPSPSASSLPLASQPLEEYEETRSLPPEDNAVSSDEGRVSDRGEMPEGDFQEQALDRSDRNSLGLPESIHDSLQSSDERDFDDGRYREQETPSDHARREFDRTQGFGYGQFQEPPLDNRHQDFDNDRAFDDGQFQEQEPPFDSFDNGPQHFDNRSRYFDSGAQDFNGGRFQEPMFFDGPDFDDGASGFDEDSRTYDDAPQGFDSGQSLDSFSHSPLNLENFDDHGPRDPVSFNDGQDFDNFDNGFRNYDRFDNSPRDFDNFDNGQHFDNVQGDPQSFDCFESAQYPDGHNNDHDRDNLGYDQNGGQSFDRFGGRPNSFSYGSPGGNFDSQIQNFNGRRGFERCFHDEQSFDRSPEQPLKDSPRNSFGDRNQQPRLDPLQRRSYQDDTNSITSEHDRFCDGQLPSFLSPQRRAFVRSPVHSHTQQMFGDHHAGYYTPVNVGSRASDPQYLEDDLSYQSDEGPDYVDGTGFGSASGSKSGKHKHGEHQWLLPILATATLGWGMDALEEQYLAANIKSSGWSFKRLAAWFGGSKKSRDALNVTGNELGGLTAGNQDVRREGVEQRQQDEKLGKWGFFGRARDKMAGDLEAQDGVLEGQDQYLQNDRHIRDMPRQDGNLGSTELIDQDMYCHGGRTSPLDNHIEMGPDHRMHDETRNGFQQPSKKGFLPTLSGSDKNSQQMSGADEGSNQEEKPGFFSRLFGSLKKHRSLEGHMRGEDAGHYSMQGSPNLGHSSNNHYNMYADDQMEFNQHPPKRQGFWARLFGSNKKSKSSEHVANDAEVSSQPSKQQGPFALASTTSRSDVDHRHKKQGFFARIFGGWIHRSNHNADDDIELGIMNRYDDGDGELEQEQVRVGTVNSGSPQTVQGGGGSNDARKSSRADLLDDGDWQYEDAADKKQRKENLKRGSTREKKKQKKQVDADEKAVGEEDKIPKLSVGEGGGLFRRARSGGDGHGVARPEPAKKAPTRVRYAPMAPNSDGFYRHVTGPRPLPRGTGRTAAAAVNPGNWFWMDVYWK